MKKSTKGALAAGAAAVVLLGGAGSLAYWTDSANVDGGNFKTGSVKLTADDCSTATWKYTTAGHTTDTVTSLVPGDSIAKDCTVTLTGTGDHLYVSLNVPTSVAITRTPAATGTDTLKATASATFDYNGTTYASGDIFKVASGSSAKVTVHYAVTFPYGDATATDANDTQNLTATLASLPITLKQEVPTTTP
jgi:alternate signal-mediated exported protein